jgi:hypothetical protein
LPMLAWLLAASYSIIIFPWYSLSNYWFWTFLLPIPLTVYAGNALDKMAVFTRKTYTRKLILGISLVGIVAFGYSSSVVSIGYPLAYTYMPPGLVKSCVDFEDIPDIQVAINWVNTNLPISAIVVVPESFQGFAVMGLREDIRIRVAPALTNLENISNLINWKEGFWSIYQLNEVGNESYDSYALLVAFGKVGIFESL